MQWNLYAPGLPGAVNVALLPGSTVTSNKAPLRSAVTVWVTWSMFVTLTRAPGRTLVRTRYAKLLIVITDAAAAGAVPVAVPLPEGRITGTACEAGGELDRAPEPGDPHPLSTPARTPAKTPAPTTEAQRMKQAVIALHSWTLRSTVPTQHHTERL